MTATFRFLAITLLLTACRKSDDVPTYVDIAAVEVSATDLQGGSTSKITDVWVSVNDRSMGSWELPARIPVLGEGPHTLSVTAAIKRNGSYDDRLRYPYYTTWNAPVDLVPGETRTVSPVVTYEPVATFWLERFNDAGNLFSVSENSDTTLLLYTAAEHPLIVLDGTSCAGFALETGRERMSIFTEEDFTPSFGAVFLELDYSTDINLTIGLNYIRDGLARSEPWVVLVPTTAEGGLRWNKVYIDLSEFFNTAGITGRDFYLTAQLPSGQSTAQVYLDNVKLVRRSS